MAIFILGFAFAAESTLAQSTTPTKDRTKADSRNSSSQRSPAASGLESGEGKSLEVRGQARTLSMMLVLKNGKEEINFIKVRNNYKKEILDSGF